MTNENNPIPLITPDNSAAHSGDVAGENVATLKALFPQIVTDGKVDFDVLRQLLGDAVEVGEERYGLNWKGKAKARAHALTPTLATLRPAKDDSVNWDTTQNLLIEGDNLEVLKTLRKAYAGKVKLIYIDPPYNTGKDFVYPDNYTDSLANYQSLTGQRDGDGVAMTSSKESSGRFHTDWLNMIYPRLLLAKDLLRDDGFLAVSIDDNELSNLATLCAEIFGDDAASGIVVWEKMYTTKNDAAGLSGAHEYIVIFSMPSASVGLLPRTAEMDARYTNPDNDHRGSWKAIPLSAKGERKNGRYPVVSPITGKQHFPAPNCHWLYVQADVERMIEENRISFGRDGNGLPNVKRFLTEVQQGTKARTLWGHADTGTNDSAKREMREIFAESKDNLPFDFPKPTSLLRKAITLLSADPESIIVDFFAGSGTTGHAVIAQNAADGGKRRYILIQLPEMLDPSKKEQQAAADFCDKIGKPRTIAELTKERLRRASSKVKADHPQAEIDAGFRVYKLDSSNLKPWQPNPDDLEASLLDAVSNVIEGRSEEDLLVELLLKTGIDLTTHEKVKVVAGKTVHALGGGALIICLADIGDEDAEALGHGLADWQTGLHPAGQTTFYFKDTGFASASAKANIAAILRQRLGDKIAKLASI